MITAHAGALGTRANSLESLKTCVDFFGASGCIEVDVRFNGAGVPVLTHNAPIFGENTLELSRLFELIKGTNITLNLDLKERSNLGEIQRLGKVFSVL
ncbi:MAG: hypothetical protein FWG82_04010, partial [Oscillospiraceae bacterium]|nr:hypothetical protein [Oscillospiraceae bacterium]